MSVSHARLVAYRALVTTRERQGYLMPVLEGALLSAPLGESDRALATRLARGVIETLGVLDESLDTVIDRPRRVEPRVRDLLRMGAYELLFMHTPEHAVVHEYVDLAGAVRSQAGGLANAVLRRLAERAASFPWGDVNADVGALARGTGHPQWLAERLVRELGSDAAATVLTSGGFPAPMFVRTNPFIATAEDARAALAEDGAVPEPAPPDDLSFRLAEPRAAVRGRAIAEGLVIVTDAAAQVAPLALDAHPEESVLDACAGRGTKTVALQSVAAHRGAPARVVALDVHQAKVAALGRRMAELHVPQVRAAVADVTNPADVTAVLGGRVDRALLDAPCTGTGTMRRHPEIRWRLTPEDVARMAELQSAMLRTVASVVRPGGTVVYSTCSIFKAETSEVLQTFLDGEAGREFATSPLEDVVPSAWRGLVTPEGWFQSLPSSDGPDGHFVARLVRR